MLLVYSFFFNLLISQFCGVYSTLAADIQGYARLARGEIILDTLKVIEMRRWKTFISSLSLATRLFHPLSLLCHKRDLRTSAWISKKAI